MPDDVDPCGVIDMTDPAHLTEDGEDQTALVLFADCWDDPAEVERRKAEWAELFDV